MPGQVVKYAPVQPGERLHQGEFLAGLVQARQSSQSIGTANLQIDEITYPYVVVMTQDCDLEQDFAARSGGQGNLLNVLFCEAVPIADLKSNVPKGSDIWKRIIQNKDERYHCLEEVPAAQDSTGNGIPTVGCDLKRYFTVSTDEVYKRIEIQQITRRSRLITPYAEHLVQRFCNFQARIPLQETHQVS